MDYQTQYDFYLQMLDTRLPTLASACFDERSKVGEAALYSLLAGGKRTRGVLTLAVCALLGGSMDAAIHFACAVEMLHCYSLIHDDLPCMDNDDYRRGKPSCHKAYGEDTALLAGDALLTGAFAVLAATPTSGEAIAKAVAVLAQSAGAKGMIWGQELDLHFETVQANEAQLQEIHRNKTGMLINAAVQLGAIAADADAQKRTVLEEYAFSIGLCFQILDDILDVTSTAQTLGKPIGSDVQNNKTTFVTLYGLAASQEKAKNLTENALALLAQNFKAHDTAFLCALTNALSNRKK